jgi:hypothetical protein
VQSCYDCGHNIPSFSIIDDGIPHVFQFNKLQWQRGEEPPRFYNASYSAMDLWRMSSNLFRQSINACGKEQICSFHKPHLFSGYYVFCNALKEKDNNICGCQTYGPFF